MAPQLLPTPIGKHDFEEYLRDVCDFTFELKVLQILNDCGCSCEHSGTYDDPTTGKSRQFDIRAQVGNERQYLFSVECKNIRENFPLIAHCTERTSNESFHDLVASLGRNRTVDTQAGSKSFHASGKRRRIKNLFYKSGEFVARSFDQVGRTNANPNRIVNSDSEVFEKLSQAIQSAFGLFGRAHCNKERIVSCVIPIVVVPKDRLWKVSYNSIGAQIDSVEQVNRVSLFVGRECPVSSRIQVTETYTLSHLEILTDDYLPQFINELTSNQTQTWGTVFPFLGMSPEQILTSKSFDI